MDETCGQGMVSRVKESGVREMPRARLEKEILKGFHAA